MRWAVYAFFVLGGPITGWAAVQWSYVKTIAEITVTGTAAAVFASADILAGNGHVQATVATCSLTGANIRLSWDGQAATTNLGQIVTPGEYVLQGTDVLVNLSAIRDDSTNAALNCVVMGQ